MPGSWPPSPSDKALNEMPFSPGEDDDMPPLDTTEDTSPQIETPIASAAQPADIGPEPPLPSTAPPLSFAAALACLLSTSQSSLAHPPSSVHAAPDVSTTPPGSPPVANIQAAAGATTTLDLPDIGAVSSTLHGNIDSAEHDDGWEDAPTNEQDEMPPLEAAVPLAMPSPPSMQASFMANLAQHMATLSAEIANASPGTQTGAANDAGPTNTPPGPSPPMLSATPNAQELVANSLEVFSAAITAAVNGDGANLPLGLGALTPVPLPNGSGFSVQNVPMGPNGATISFTMIEDNEGSDVSAVTPSLPTGAPLMFGSLGNLLGGMPSLHDPDYESLLPPWPSRRPRFHAVAFVDTLEEVDISTIPTENMRCPHCWLPFGITDEDDPAFALVSDPDVPSELAVRQMAFREMPFCAARADNDPVRTPCGHIFGRGCLIESLEKVDTLCPTCRRELRLKPEVPNLPE